MDRTVEEKARIGLARMAVDLPFIPDTEFGDLEKVLKLGKEIRFLKGLIRRSFDVKCLRCKDTGQVPVFFSRPQLCPSCLTQQQTTSI
jgi:hypothetical protein